MIEKGAGSRGGFLGTLIGHDEEKIDWESSLQLHYHRS
jgi:hypothetical protein